ncbi:MAG: hypothetical protein IPN76_09665 [Saprospiraceae bacterium]|nr:hypothetical protein [Saprospiraceae bacterium]
MKDPLGIFASLYLDVTKSVREGILHNGYQDGPRMERLDVVFANRYLEAYDAYRQGLPCTKSWQTAFDAAKSFDLLVLQYLLMGMNAHINLDLGIAAAETVPADQLPQLEADFNGINQVLAEKIDAVQDKLSDVSPLLFLVDWFGKKKDEHFAAFSLIAARKNAWKVANRLSKLSGEAKYLEINKLDKSAAKLNQLISKPGFFLGGLVKLVKRFELKDVGKVLDFLA